MDHCSFCNSAATTYVGDVQLCQRCKNQYSHECVCGELSLTKEDLIQCYDGKWRCVACAADFSEELSSNRTNFLNLYY